MSKLLVVDENEASVQKLVERLLELESAKASLEREATEHKQADHDLLASETRYRRLFESAKDGILILDAGTGQIVDVNPFLADLLGFSHEHFLGKKLWEIGFFKDVEASEEAFIELQQKGYIRYEDLPLKTRDGRPISVEFVSNVYPVDSTTVIQCNIRDITERKRAAEAMRAVSSHQDALLAAVPDIIMEVDANRVYTWANPAGLAFFGEDVIGKEADSYFEGEQETYGLLRPLFSGDENVIPLESWQRRRDGEKRLLAWRCRALKDGQGNVTGAISSARDITEREQVRAELASLAKFPGESPNPVLRITGNGTLLYANRASVTVLAHEGMEAGREVPEQWRAWMAQALDAANNKGVELECDGEIFGLLFTPIAESGYTNVYGRNITRRKKAEEALKFTNTLLLTQQEAAIDGILVVDENGIILSANGRFTELMGIPRELLLMRDDAPVLQLAVSKMAEPEAFLQRVRYLYEHREEISREEILLKDGRTFDRYSAPIFGDDRQYYGRVWYFRDITDSKRAEEALRASEAKFRGIVDNIGVGVVLIGADMRIIEMNRQMREWYPDIRPEEHPVCHREFNSPPSEEPCSYCPTNQTLRDGQVHEATTATPWKKSTRTYRIVSSPLHDERGRVVAAIELVDDVTERLSLQQQLNQAQKMESVGQLAGGVAHDFNNILQAIVGYSGMLLDCLPEHDEKHEFAEEIARGAARAAALTRQLLVFSRRQILEMEDVNLNDVVHDLMKMIRRIIGEDIEVAVMEGSPLGIVHADRGQMEQVLLNFCVNARDAMLEGGTLTIDTENVLMDAEYCAAHAWATPGNYVLLSVTDTGCGMDAETQAHIFEPFFTTKELGKGTGLGLATVYGIVRQHQGMIQVYSEPEKGTTFKVYLPCVERAAATVAPKVAGRARGGTETILVAEDDATLRKLAELILETAGYTVLLATNGREALDVFEKHACGTDGSANIDLCLLDVIMPKLGGKAVYDALRPLHPRLRFLFSSGYSTSAIHRDLVLEEGIGLIQKPYAPDALLRKVRQVLDDVALIAEADPISESDEKQETNPK